MKWGTAEAQNSIVEEYRIEYVKQKIYISSYLLSFDFDETRQSMISEQYNKQK